MTKKLINATDDTTKSVATSTSPSQQEIFLLEQRKVKALEKISNSIDALTLWVEEIDKDVWGPRIEHYLHEWYKTSIEPNKLDD
jgi:hypothetical protein